MAEIRLRSALVLEFCEHYAFADRVCKLEHDAAEHTAR
jgi:hypothetical protein